MPERLQPSPAENAPQLEAAPTPQPLKKKVVIVDTSDSIDERARDVAESRMTESKESQKGIGGFARKIWKHNLFHEYYRQKEIIKVKKGILDSQNLYDGEATRNVRDDASASIVEQFASQYDEAIHTDVGEVRKSFGENPEQREREDAVKAQIKQLVIDFAHRDLTDHFVRGNFLEEKSRIFSSLKDARGDVIDKGNLYADNLLEVAREVQQNIEHGAKLEELDLDFDVVIGKAKSGVRTEAQFNACDRILEKIQSTKLGSLVNETTAASAVALAYSVGAFVSKRVLNSKAAAWGTFGATAVISAGFAGAREKKRLEEERRQHGREIAMGKKYDPEKSPRRKEMEQFRHETREANALSDDLEQSIYETGPDGEQIVRNLTPEQLQEALGKVAEIESRIKLSDTQKVDLISYSDVTKISEERLRLDTVRAKAKVDLRAVVAARAAHPGQELNLPQGRSVDDFLASATALKADTLVNGDAGMEKRNQLFRSMRNKKVVKAALVGLATGLVIGGVAQELKAYFGNTAEGVFGNHSTDTLGVHHMTALASLRRYLAHDLPHPVSGTHDVALGDIHAKLPDGVSLEDARDGTFTLHQGSKVLGDHIKFDASGHLTEASKRTLAEHGVIASSADHVVTGTRDASVPPDEYVRSHAGSFTHVHRDVWYGNDTPAPVFDKNELRADLFVDPSHGGEYQYSMARMAADGSYQTMDGTKLSADAHALAAAGKLKMIFSLSSDTQTQVVEVPIGADFKTHIDPNSEIGKMFFQTVKGKPVFMGKFAEVAQVMGSKDGVEHVRLLATDVGKGITSVADHVPTVGKMAVNTFSVPADYRVDPPFVIPLRPRTPLEPTARNVREQLPAEPVPPVAPVVPTAAGLRERLSLSESLAGNPVVPVNGNRRRNAEPRSEDLGRDISTPGFVEMVPGLQALLSAYKKESVPGGDKAAAEKTYLQVSDTVEALVKRIEPLGIEGRKAAIEYLQSLPKVNGMDRIAQFVRAYMAEVPLPLEAARAAELEQPVAVPEARQIVAGESSAVDVDLAKEQRRQIENVLAEFGDGYNESNEYLVRADKQIKNGDAEGAAQSLGHVRDMTGWLDRIVKSLAGTDRDAAAASLSALERAEALRTKNLHALITTLQAEGRPAAKTPERVKPPLYEKAVELGIIPKLHEGLKLRSSQKSSLDTFTLCMKEKGSPLEQFYGDKTLKAQDAFVLALENLNRGESATMRGFFLGVLDQAKAIGKLSQAKSVLRIIGRINSNKQSLMPLVSEALRL